MGRSVKWKYIGASVRGTSHQEQSVACQDKHDYRCQEIGDHDVFWSVVADGAGSASLSETGAEVASYGVANKIERWLARHEGQVGLINEDVVTEWVQTAQTALVSIAAHKQRPVRDYACTILGIVCGTEQAVAFQIGDGAIVTATDADDYSIVFWPQTGEYANSTYFVTDTNALDHLQVKLLPYAPHKLALMTDGVHKLALHFASQTVHAPFFAPLFHRLKLEEPGHARSLNQQLEEFLDSKPVNQRTDDDKTLILALREP